MKNSITEILTRWRQLQEDPKVGTQFLFEISTHMEGSLVAVGELMKWNNSKLLRRFSWMHHFAELGLLVILISVTWLMIGFIMNMKSMLPMNNHELSGQRLAVAGFYVIIFYATLYICGHLMVSWHTRIQKAINKVAEAMNRATEWAESLGNSLPLHVALENSIDRHALEVVETQYVFGPNADTAISNVNGIKCTMSNTLSLGCRLGIIDDPDDVGRFYEKAEAKLSELKASGKLYMDFSI